MGAALLLVACAGFPNLTFTAADAALADASPPPLDAALTTDAEQGDAGDVSVGDGDAGVRGGGGDAGVSDAELLPCGDAGPCAFATDSCCLTKLGFECIIRGTACSGINLQCSEGDECNGNKVCCGVLDDGGGVRRFACVGASACANAGGAPACDPDASTPCPNGTSCTPTPVEGYAICK
jgi:hypothetical protein